MSGMADAYEKQMNDPNADLTSFEERFASIVEHEWKLRYDKKFNRLLKLARLRYPSADIDDSINDPARKLDAASIMKLSEGHWIDEGKNLLEFYGKEWNLYKGKIDELLGNTVTEGAQDE